MFSIVQKSVRGWLGLPPAETDANQLGIWHYQRGEFEEAVRAFDAGLRKAPRSVGIWCNRANACYCLGRHEEAVADYTRAIEAKPTLDAYYGRAMVLAQMGRKEEAIADLGEALRLNRTATELYYTRANLWSELDRLDDAWADYDSVLRLDPTHAEARGMRGRLSDLLGRPDAATADYDAVLRPDAAVGVKPRVLGTTHNNRGHIHHRRGDYARARADFTAAIKLAPKLPNGYKNLAWLQATCPDSTFLDGPGAVANAQRAWEISKGRRLEWLDIVAAAHAQAADWPAAIDWQERAVANASEKDRPEQAARLELYRSHQPYRDAANRRFCEDRIKVR
jgi:tetratricopeptide (TPR) repeat protein